MNKRRQRAGTLVRANQRGGGPILSRDAATSGTSADCAAGAIALRMATNHKQRRREHLPDNAPPVVRTERRGSIALVLIDNPPVNASSQAVRQGLASAIGAADADPAIEAVVIACEGRTFVAGADIREFGKPPLAPALPDVLAIVEASKKPVVAAVHGTALGGGFELALACHARVLDAEARVGLPEVKLGLIPGAGGTQRLPRLIGLRDAIDLASSGRQVKAKEALALGIADAIAEGDLREAAIALARAAIGQPIRRLSESADAAIRSRRDRRRAGGGRRKNRAARPRRSWRRAPFCSPPNCLSPRAWRASAPLSSTCLHSDQSKAMRYVFTAEREAPRAPQLEGIAPRRVDERRRDRRRHDGRGDRRGLRRRGLSRRGRRDQRGGGRGRAQAHRRALGSSGQIGAARGQRSTRRAARGVAVSADFAALARCDLVVEAAFEDMAVKTGHVHAARRDGAARRGAGDQHLLPRCRRHRRGERPARRCDRPAFLLARECDAPRRSGRGAGQRAGTRWRPASRSPSGSARSPSSAACATASSAIASSPIGGRSST